MSDFPLHFDRDLASAQAERQDLQARRPILEQRARILAATREFFTSQGFLEVETPIRIPTPALEDYIEVEPAGKAWLRTSPEFHMKRLLAAGYEKIFQLGACFRPDECGSRHQPEFTMLEWYRLHSDWQQLALDITELAVATARKLDGRMVRQFKGHTLDLTPPWPAITVQDAFRQFADADVDEACANGTFEQILVEAVEPMLGLTAPQFLTEYPLANSGLSRAFPDRPDRVERWELYAAGLELANACTELTDALEQEKRFQDTADLRRRENRPLYDIDQPFMNALHLGIPQAAGVAIGMDRFVMLFTAADDIRKVLAFPH